MKKQSAAITQPTEEAAPMKVLPASNLFDRIEDLSNSIARRAFEIFEGRGCEMGHDLEDWFRAESELLHPMHLDISESDDALTVHAEVPGFGAKELEVGVERHRLTISGKQETSIS
jgi:HSP20 family molecular chaperone IbpA